MTLDEGHYYFYYIYFSMQQKVNFMALEKPGKLGDFFLLLCGHPAIVQVTDV